MPSCLLIISQSGWRFSHSRPVCFDDSTIAGEIISHHGVPRELLSYRGTAFLSKLLHKLYRLMDIHKVSTTAYHPQTDGLVEQFHRMLTAMLSKTTQLGGADWDE